MPRHRQTGVSGTSTFFIVLTTHNFEYIFRQILRGA
jgi:hypothetical protein